MLGLVIIVIIVVNVFLWNYEMNRLDWEKMQEDVEIIDVTRVTRSSWFVAQSEYTVNTGTRISGTYTDTQAIDGQYESFREASNWWNTNYNYRRQITITNNIASTLSSGYSVLLTMDTASLVSSGKMLSNGNDLRIVYWNGSSWIEIDRDVIDMNTSSTQVWFKTRADISASGSDNNYYMYYDNPSAVNPPANKNNVYDFWDDFDDGSLDPAWTFSQIGGASGSYSESGTVVILNATTSGDLWSTSDNFLFLSISRSYDVLVESYTSGWEGFHDTWSKMGGVQLRQSLDANSKNRIMSPVYSAAGATNSYRLSAGGSTSEQTTGTQPKYCRLSRIGGTSRARYSTDGISWTELGSQISFSGGLSDPVRLGINLSGLSSSSHWVEVDWFKVRKYVDPEPSTSLGSEESYAYAQVTVSSEQMTTNTAWTDVPGASVSFTPGSSTEEWLIIVTADIRSSSTSEDQARFRYDINGTVQRGETGVQQGTTSTSPIDPYNVYFHFSRITGVTSQQTVKFQFQASLGATAYARNIHILCIRLDPASLEYTEVNGDTSITGSQTLETLQFTPPSSGDYIIAYCALVSELPTGSAGAETWLDYDYGTSLYPDAWSTPNSRRIHTDRDQFEPHGVFARVNLDTNQHTFRVRALLRTAGDTSTARDVRIAAFRVDAFDLLEYDEDTAVSSTTGRNTVRSVVNTANPGEERDYLVLAGIHTISSGTSSREAGGAEIDDVFVQRKGDQRLSYSQIARIASHYAYIKTSSASFKVETTYGTAGTGTNTTYSKASVIYVLKIPKNYGQSNRLDIDGTFVIDVSTYPLDYIQTLEIQLSYRADDAGEKWYLKAYNWSSSTYSDSGFNSTAGHTPTTGWDYYAVNLTDGWRSYVQDNGTIYVKVVDEGADSNQTTIDIDFLGVRVAINGARFTFKNKGSLTFHLVSLWVINSTIHKRYDLDIFVNSADTLSYLRADIRLPNGQYTVKVVTERGNIAIYSGS